MTPPQLTATEEATSRLADLWTNVPMMRGSILASVDGRVLAADLDRERQDATAAVVASSYALGGKLAEVVGAAPLAEMTVATTDGSISLYAVGSRGVLAAMTMPEANLGLLNLQARKTAEQLAPIVDHLIEPRVR